MTDAPVVFSFESTEVRTFADDKGEMWFSATEVCGILGYRNPWDATAKHCRSDGLAKREVIDSLGRVQEATYINEPNLYRLIIKSRKPEAERFERWVMEEVLPAIRETGHFDARRGLPQLSVPQLLATQRQVGTLMQALKRETEPAIRRTLHAKLEQACRLLAIPAPALTELGRDARPDHENPLIEEFWEVYEMLAADPEARLNHARDKRLIAVNLPQVRAVASAARLALPDMMELRRILRACRAPRFLAVKAVNSPHVKATVKCWVFERPATSR
jgi:prophage antirepressor-like protein